MRAAHGELVIEVGDHALLPGTAGQQVPLYVSGGDAVAGVNLFVQVGDGGPQLVTVGLPAGTPGPAITAVDLKPAGGILAAVPDPMLTYPGIPQVASASLALGTPGASVAAQGLLAVLTVDTSGFDSGYWELRLADVLPGMGGYTTDFAPVPVRIVNGSIHVPGPARQWVGSTAGVWEAAGNWSGQQVPMGPGAVAVFGSGIAADATVTLGGTVKLGTLRFDQAGASYRLEGAGALRLSGISAMDSAGIEVLSGRHAVDVAVNLEANAVFHVAGGGRLTLGGTLNLHAGQTVTKTGGGTLEVCGPVTGAAGAAWALTDGQVILNVDAGAPVAASNQVAVTFTANQHLAALSLAGGASVQLADRVSGPGVLVVSAVSVDGLSRLDLRGNALIVAQGDLEDLTELLESGCADNTWAGPGITSSVAAGTGQRPAIVKNDGTSMPLLTAFAGEPLAADDVLIVYAWAGDANLDGQVDFNDYLAMEAGYRFSASGAVGWGQGDFNYDGHVTAEDYALVDAVVARQDPFLASRMVAEHTAEFGAAYTTALAAVPEPASVGVLAAGMAGLLGRRRGARGRR